MPTSLRFGDDHYIAVQEEFAEVRQRIEESESSQMPLFEATRVDGTRMLLNANEIRTISEGKKKDGGGKS